MITGVLGAPLLGRFPASWPRPATLVLPGEVEGGAIGDSFVSLSYATGTAARFDTRGAIHVANQILGGPIRFRLTGIAGIVGETSAEINARLAAFIAATPGQRLTYISSGNNDINTGVSVATAVANITHLIQTLNANGRVVITGPVLTRDTYDSTKIANTILLNAAIKALARPGSLIYADYWDALIGVDGLPRANMLYDGIHLGARGARFAGPALAAAMNPLLAGSYPLATALSPGLLPNGLLAGTDGTMNLAFTGQNATGFNFFHSSSTTGGTKSCAKVANPDGHGSILRVSFAGITVASGMYAGGPQTTANYAALGLAEGDWFDLAVRVRAVGPTTNCLGATIGIFDNNGSSSVSAAWTYFASGGLSHLDDIGTDWITIRTPPLQRRVDAGSDLVTIRLNVTGEGGLAGGITATIDFTQVTLRKLP